VAVFVSVLIRLLTYLVIVQAILSYFMSPYHPFRQAIDAIVEPMLAPIRRLVPPMSGLDFSPLVLIILIQLLGGLLLQAL
jgi:YggT family protein